MYITIQTQLVKKVEKFGNEIYKRKIRGKGKQNFIMDGGSGFIKLQ